LNAGFFVIISEEGIMSNTKTLESYAAKKRRILIGCSIAGTAAIMAGAGIGIGYAIWNSKKRGGIIIEGGNIISNKSQHSCNYT
jgi:hypothetical protein